MPKWNLPTENTENTEILKEVMRELHAEIDEHSSFIEVVGISPDQMMQHAIEAVAIYQGTDDLTSTDGLLRLYGLGFVIGTKYGQRMQHETHHEGGDG